MARRQKGATTRHGQRLLKFLPLPMICDTGCGCTLPWLMFGFAASALHRNNFVLRTQSFFALR